VGFVNTPELRSRIHSDSGRGPWSDPFRPTYQNQPPFSCSFSSPHHIIQLAQELFLLFTHIFRHLYYDSHQQIPFAPAAHSWHAFRAQTQKRVRVRACRHV